MKRTISKVFVVVVSLLLFTCKEEAENQKNPVMKYDKKTVEIDANTSQLIESIDDSRIVFQSSNTQINSLAPGSIIVSGATTQAPFGFLRKISSIETDGEKKTLVTTEASLTEAFDELHVDYSKVYGSTDTRGRIRGTEFVIGIEKEVLYDGDEDEETETDQIMLDGTIKLVPEIHFKVDITKGILEYARVEGNFNSELTQELTAGGLVGTIGVEKEIFSKPLSLIFVPGTPIVLVPNLRLNIGAEASINFSVSASNATTAEVKSYVEYADGEWKTGYTQSMENTFEFSGVAGSLGAKVYVEPGIDFKLWNSNWAKAGVVSQLYVELEGQLLPTQNCELKAGINAGAEVQLKLFSIGFSAGVFPEIFDFSKTLYSCSEDPKLPTLTTKPATGIATTTAESGGIISSDGASGILSRGVCWSTSANPTIDNSKTLNGTGSGEFNSSITDLTPNTTYYVRAYATNSVGTSYGDEVQFTTLQVAAPTVTDIDGNVYPTIAIGDQVWMAENLRVTTYRNGDPIQNMSNETVWSTATSGGYSVYDDNDGYAPLYGRLYNGYAVLDARGLCPNGWHVPSDEEWKTLELFFGMTPEETNTYDWRGATIGTEFKEIVLADFGGYREDDGTYYGRTDHEYWWSNTEFSEGNLWERGVRKNYTTVFRAYNYVKFGFAVRCLKN